MAEDDKAPPSAPEWPAIDRRRRWSRLQFSLIGLLYGVLVVGAGLVLNNLRAIHGLGLELTRLQVEVKGLAQRDDLLRDDMQARLDTLETTLFGEVVSKLDKPSVEGSDRVLLWQVNRDRELRDRLTRLEQWRLRTER